MNLFKYIDHFRVHLKLICNRNDRKAINNNIASFFSGFFLFNLSYA